MSQRYTFFVQGMHCASCEVLIGEQCLLADGVTEAKATLGDRCLVVTCDQVQDPAELASRLSRLTEEHGYQISAEKTSATSLRSDLVVSGIIALFLLAGFVLLQRLGLTEFITGDQMNYATAFLLGLIASVSTCLAIVGGLVLSIASASAKRGGGWHGPMLFHVGRIAGFFVLGGVIGSLGGVFQLGYRGTAVLSLLAAVIMLVLGLNLIELSSFTKRMPIRFPVGWSSVARRFTHSSHILAPLLAGIATFFLPCGFTQSMQVYALSTGSFVTGGMTMLVFALGTLPVLALLSFGAVQIAHRPWKKRFFHVVGFVVIALALFNLWNGLASLGFVNPISFL